MIPATTQIIWKNHNTPTPVCPICTSWMDLVTIDKDEWLKCRSCGFMTRVAVKKRRPV